MGNWQLYPQALQEMGRVCRPSTARAVLLTHDNKALSQVQKFNSFYLVAISHVHILYVSVGIDEEYFVEESGDSVDQCWWTHCSRLCSSSQQPNMQAFELKP